MIDDLIDVLKKLNASEKPYAIATVVETVGSVSAKTGAKAVVDHQGTIVYGWVGGGCAESSTCMQALDCIESGQTTVFEIDLDDEVLGAGMPCGGHMRVYIEPVLPKPNLWIMGHGRIAECLCSLGDMMGFGVVVHDPLVNRDLYPHAKRLIDDDPSYKHLDPAAGDFMVIATQHKGDHESMKIALNSQAKYIALIASRKRARLVLDYLAEEGFQQDDIDRVVTPCGIDIGARSPEEIALSIISEIVLTRRGGSGKFKSSQLNTALPGSGKPDATVLDIAG